jgi:hypothetical protein
MQARTLEVALAGIRPAHVQRRRAIYLAPILRPRMNQIGASTVKRGRVTNTHGWCEWRVIIQRLLMGWQGLQD